MSKEYTGTEYICTLPDKAKGAIVEELVKLNPHFDFMLDINSIMDGRLCDLEPVVDWKEVICNA